MCTAGRVRYSCNHLGRKLGFEYCLWFKLADTSIKLGASKDDAKVVLNEQRCAQEAVTKYINKDRKCRACMKMDREEKGKAESVGGVVKEVWEGRKREDW
jgi:hypothetical protein